jgi:hypothetical protein
MGYTLFASCMKMVPAFLLPISKPDFLINLSLELEGRELQEQTVRH